MAKSRLHQLSELGQSVWIDYLSRDLIHGGELERMMREDAVVGVTSNPTIFQKAISHGNAYDEQLRELIEAHLETVDAFFRLAERDVGDACDLLHGVWEETAGRDGYVSIEVDPNLAYQRGPTYDQAKELHERINKPNLLVKIPGTEPGLGAIEDSIAAGRSINITLIFSLSRYKDVVEA
jgi:transaldolase